MKLLRKHKMGIWRIRNGLTDIGEADASPLLGVGGRIGGLLLEAHQPVVRVSGEREMEERREMLRGKLGEMRLIQSEGLASRARHVRLLECGSPTNKYGAVWLKASFEKKCIILNSYTIQQLKLYRMVIIIKNNSEKQFLK